LSYGRLMKQLRGQIGTRAEARVRLHACMFRSANELAASAIASNGPSYSNLVVAKQPDFANTFNRRIVSPHGVKGKNATFGSSNTRRPCPVADRMASPLAGPHRRPIRSRPVCLRAA